MRIIVGLTKKIGLPGYGSLAATCQVESAELSSVPSAGDFAARVERVFASCRDAVEAELRIHQPRPDREARQRSEGRLNYNGNGVRPVTPRQLNVLRTLASKSRHSRSELDRIFGGKAMDALSIVEASTAIDRLKGVGAIGRGNGRATFEGGQ
jgi:hypothetical protein